MSTVEWDVEAARKDLGVSRREMAALLDVDQGEYLRLEAVGTELPPEVQHRIASLLEAKVERQVSRSTDEGSGFTWVGRNVVDLAVRMAGVITAISGGTVLATAGHVGIGVLIAGGGLLAIPFAGYRVSCRCCGARVSLVSMARRSCGRCGTPARR